LCRVRIMSISSFLLSFSKSDRCIMLTQSTTELTLCKQCAHQPLKKAHPTEQLPKKKVKNSVNMNVLN
jgi:hypothetical protein